MDILNNIHMIQVPVPYPLKTVNCYLINNKGKWSMIDTGANTEEAKQFWNDVFKKKGIKNSSLTDIYITHIHPDHMGLEDGSKNNITARYI